MKQTNFSFRQKRRIWNARLDVFIRGVERWIDENHKTAFWGFVMGCLFLLQFLLFLR